MPDQPEALRLADALEDRVDTDGWWSREQCDLAATELRIRYAEWQRMKEERDALRAEVERLRVDAERLDWLDSLRDRAASTDVHLAHGAAAVYVRTGIGSNIESRGTAHTLRAAIDAARGQGC